MLSELEVTKIINGTIALMRNTIKDIEDNSRMKEIKDGLKYFDTYYIHDKVNYGRTNYVLTKINYLRELQKDLNTFRFFKEGRQYKGDRRYDVD